MPWSQSAKRAAQRGFWQSRDRLDLGAVEERQAVECGDPQDPRLVLVKRHDGGLRKPGCATPIKMAERTYRRRLDRFTGGWRTGYRLTSSRPQGGQNQNRDGLRGR